MATCTRARSRSARLSSSPAKTKTKKTPYLTSYPNPRHRAPLHQLFSASGLEGPELAADESLNNHMGLFLQKTNIIRDYLEDIVEEPAPR